ncbi:hypothetical protein M513_10664 [Trichuris suis]|uniref:Uncharacterized protein n=1 Tax=Trichuris suis TaxID=68888 RepID=A0A085LU00_9BILA|nr:hypothetical protein M513_10664 [Trichuris suis]
MEETVTAPAIVEGAVKRSFSDEDLSTTALRQELDFCHKETKQAPYIRQNTNMNRNDGVGVSDIWSELAFLSGCCTPTADQPNALPQRSARQYGRDQ